MVDRESAEVLALRARIGTLEQLLEVYERSVVEQSDKLYAEQERMRFQKTLLECQGEASLDGILSLGVDGAILSANRRLSEMWGVPAPRIGAKSREEVLRSLAERTTDPNAFIERASALDSADEIREEIALRDGRTFDQYTAPIRSREGNHFGRVWYFRDISTFKEIGRMKDEFISAVSHELRTPLTSIRGSLDLMDAGVMGDLPEDSLKVVKIAKRNCDRLVRLINEVLDIEKIEAGRMDFQLQELELEPLLEQAVEAIASYGDMLGVAFRLAVTAPGARARVDPDRLLQVMENLLSNAAKFSAPGGHVDVVLSRRGGYARVSVVDRGAGIAPEFQSRIFDKFSQAGSKQPRQRGTGLGLNIARTIVERLGGNIGFSSKLGEGSTFHVDLPLWSADSDAETAR